MEQTRAKSRFAIASVVAAALVIFASLSLLVLTAEKSSATLWDGYRILCVSPADREADLLGALRDAGIGGYVTQANSALIPAQRMTPFMPFLPAAEEARAGWFFDSQGEFRLVYIDERAAGRGYEGILGELLDAAGFSWILERNTVFVPAPLFLLALFLLAAIWISPAFPAAACASVFPLLFALTKNNFAGWLSAFFCLCGVTAFFSVIFPARLSTTRAQKKELAEKHALFFLPWFFGALVAAAFAAPGLRALSFLCVPAGGTAVLFLIGKFFPRGFYPDNLLFTLKNRRRLHPVLRIEPMGFADGEGAAEKEKVPKSGAFVLQLAGAALLIPLSFFLFGEAEQIVGGARRGGKKSAFFAEKGEKGEKNAPDALYIPAPERYTSGEGFSPETYGEAVSAGCFFLDGGGENPLFSLSDFLVLQWNITAYPWRKINADLEIPKAGSAVRSGTFRESGNGVLVPEEETKAEFHSDFIMGIFETCASPLETMLIRQNRFVKAGWAEMPK